MLIQKFSILVILILIGFKAYTQILLGNNLSQIKKEVSSQGGLILRNSIEKNVQRYCNYRKVAFRFIIPPEGNSSIIDMTFYLTLKNKCFEYNETCWGTEMIKQTTDKFNKPLYNFKLKGNLKWVSSDNKIQARVFPKKTPASKVISVYVLEVKENGI